MVTVSTGLTSKSTVMVFDGFASKPVVTVSRFRPQIGNYGLVIWASKSP
jgi:hypothetical protein